jgi:hypothetical protein
MSAFPFLNKILKYEQVGGRLYKQVGEVGEVGDYIIRWEGGRWEII